MDKALVQVNVGTIGVQEGIPTVNGRDLWEGLEIGRDYTNWVKDQVNSLQLVENEDYIIFAEKGENPGRPRREVAFTLDAGKHIAMASRTTKGREVRAYFIQVEKEHAGQHTALSPAMQLMLTAKALMALEQGQQAIRGEIGELKERIGLLDGQDGYTTLAVYIKRERYKYPGPETTKAMGAMASKLSRERGEEIKPIPDAKYGKVNAYTNEIAAEVVTAFGLKRKGV